MKKEKIEERDFGIRKSPIGWIGETVTTVNGQSYKITTMKGYGRDITCSAMPTQVSVEGSFIVSKFSSNDMFNKRIVLIRESGRATEKTIKEVHYKGLFIFDEMVENGQIKIEEKVLPEIGTILFMDGYSKTKGDYGNNHIIYKIENDKYFTVEKDTLSLVSRDLPRPISDKFGIGIYFDPEFKFTGTQSDIDSLVIEAHAKLKKDREEEKNLKDLENIERQKKIDAGKQIVKVPAGAESVIVAAYYEDKSDPMTDYFATTTSKRVYLAFSKTRRNNMAELHKAKLNFEETKELEGEHNTGHSYLPDYFVGSDRWDGWKVTKYKHFDLEKNLETLYIAAAEGRYMIPEEEKRSDSKQVGSVVIFDYSDKAIAVIGDTKPIKDELKALGGRFNFRLKCGAGWIFKKSQMDEVEKLINSKQKL